MVQKYKVNAVEALMDKFKQSKHLIFTEYKGLNVEQINKLRKKLYNANSELRIVKNRLAKLAYKKLGLNFKDEWFRGPIALVVCKDDDFVNTVSIVYNFSKGNKNFKIKLGYLENKFFNIDELNAISSIPSRKKMLERIAGILNSHVIKFVYVLKNINE